MEENVPCYIILGMHRSSTSMLSKALHRSKSVYMGEDANDHGEDRDFLFLNIEILRSLNSSWDNPPNPDEVKELANSEKYRDKILSLVDKKEKECKEFGYQSWGFKDPRTVLTLPVYQDVIKNKRFVVLKRSSLEVAKSLQARNGFSIEKGVSLSDHYNSLISKYDVNSWDL
jgi:hypothetical protein